jgi:hypothetical protein
MTEAREHLVADAAGTVPGGGAHLTGGRPERAQLRPECAPGYLGRGFIRSATPRKAEADDAVSSSRPKPARS